MRQSVLCGIVLCFLVVQPTYAAEPDDGLSPSQDGSTVHEQQFLEKANQLQSLLENGQFLEARQLLMHMSQLFTQLSFDQRTTVEGIQALSDTMIQLKQLLADVQLQPEKIQKTARRLMIAADALVHAGNDGKNGMWKEHAQLLLRQLQTMRQHSPDKQSFQQLLEGYREIRPALLVSQSPDLVTQLDALLVRIKQLYLQSQPDPEALNLSLKHWEDLLNQAYIGKDRPTIAEVMRSPMSQLILGLSAFLFLSLAYTAWCYRTFRDTWET